MLPEKSRISHDTLIPMSFVLVLLGGAFWLTTIYNQGLANADAIRDEQIWKEKVTRQLGLIMGALHIDPEKGNRDD